MTETMKMSYQAMTQLPRHIEEKLLTFNVLQLCALVSEKTGPKWSGASDIYGPIQEIARRWELDALCKRIADMRPEEPLKTYAKVMTALGGNPAKFEQADRKEAERKAVWEKKTAPLEQDVVRVGLAPCLTLNDLKAVAKKNNLGDLDWGKIDGLANFGLKRMYVGNKWRAAIRRLEKK